MILVFGAPRDTTTVAVLAALERRGAPVRFVNQANVLAYSLELKFDAEVHGRLALGEQEIDLRDVTAVFARPYDSSEAPAVAVYGALSVEAFHARRFDALLTRWTEVTPAVVVNRPSAMATNDSKPFQSLTARAAGFDVAPTLLTTDRAAVDEFVATHGDVVFKSISGIRSIATRLGTEEIDRLDDVQWCPTQFQAYVPGIDVRVHVIGERVYACEIESEAVDYRYGASTKRTFEMPAEQAQQCVSLANRLGLDLTGIDLRRTPDGRWICFEANPAPAFACFGAEIERAVADAVADYLIGGISARPTRGAAVGPAAARETAPSPPGGELVVRQSGAPTEVRAIHTTEEASMRKIPKTTTPLTKFIRTGEGWLVYAFNLALLIVPIVSSALSPGDAVKWAAIIDAVTVVSRTGLKMIAASGIPPQAPDSEVAADVNVIAQELAKELPQVLARLQTREPVAS